MLNERLWNGAGAETCTMHPEYAHIVPKYARACCGGGSYKCEESCATSFDDLYDCLHSDCGVEKCEVHLGMQPMETAVPTAAPTASPSASPTEAPTAAPTAAPTHWCDDQFHNCDSTSTYCSVSDHGLIRYTCECLPGFVSDPHSLLSCLATASPTLAPTEAPTKSPTEAPSASPSASPSLAPTASPTKNLDNFCTDASASASVTRSEEHTSELQSPI